jgi:hypothetical protein
MELSVQFGVHTGQLLLENPRRRAMLMLGTHCRVEGDNRRDVPVEVDLPLAPGLVRMDNGAEATVVPCDIISL